MAGSENTVPEVAPFAKPLSIPGVHFGSATNFTINLNFGNTIIDKLALRSDLINTCQLDDYP